MTIIIETGAGVPGANTYASAAFVTTYLTDRARPTENAWDAASADRKDQATVVATDYVEKRWGPRFKGTPLRFEIIGRGASSEITFTANPLNTETVTIGQSQVFRFVATLAQENDVLIGASLADSLENLVAAATGGDGSDTVYQKDTRQNFEAVLSINEDSTSVLDVAAFVVGESGNLIALATTVTGATSTAATLTGGLDTGSQPLSFPRAGLFTRSGTTVIGIPLKLRQAVAEYAVRSLSVTLAPDPVLDTSGLAVKKSVDKVGPITEEREFQDGAVPRIFSPFPAADELLTEYVLPGGGTFR